MHAARPSGHLTVMRSMSKLNLLARYRRARALLALRGVMCTLEMRSSSSGTICRVRCALKPLLRRRRLKRSTTAVLTANLWLPVPWPAAMHTTEFRCLVSNKLAMLLLVFASSTQRVHVSSKNCDTYEVLLMALTGGDDTGLVRSSDKA